MVGSGFVTRMPYTISLAALAGLLAGTPGRAAAQDRDSAALASEAVERLREYLQINTVNPPGNEMRAVEFFARILAAQDIPFETAESAPGRGNIWARLEGGSQPALVLLHHSDVVPADTAHWDVNPLSGEIHDGYIYGRGALDTKTLGIYHLEAFLALHRAGRALNRDVIFMATADEEAGGLFGAGWLVEHRPRLFEQVGFVLNEGGGGRLDHGHQQFTIEVTQKVPIWLRLVATAKPGHGSRPRVQSATTKIVRALNRLREHRFTPRIVPPVDAYFKGIAPYADARWRDAFLDMTTAVRDPDFLLALQLDDPYLHAITRNTCSITRFGGSNKINVVPPEAWAELDCRMLPDQDPDLFLAELRAVINDPDIDVETLMVFTPAISPTDTEVYRAIAGVTREHFPDAAILPGVQSGFTDSHFFRDLGIVAYGYSPALIPVEDAAGVHGNNERISVENVRRGTGMMVEIVQRTVYDR